MKRLAPLFLLTAALVIRVLAAGTNTQNVVLAWNDTNNFKAGITSMTYRVYGSTNVGLPMASWSALATVRSTNVGTNAISVSLPVIPGAWFFTVTASNFWESDFPPAVSTPPVPTAITNLGIKPEP